MFDPEKIRPVKETRHKGHPLYDSAHIKRPKETQTDTAGSGTAHIRAPSSVVGGRPALAGRGAAPLLSPPPPPHTHPSGCQQHRPRLLLGQPKMSPGPAPRHLGGKSPPAKNPFVSVVLELARCLCQNPPLHTSPGHLAQPPPGALPVPRGRALTCPEHPRPRAGRQRVSG